MYSRVVIRLLSMHKALGSILCPWKEQQERKGASREREAWCGSPVIQLPGRIRQEDREFKARVGCIERPFFNPKQE